MQPNHITLPPPVQNTPPFPAAIPDAPVGLPAQLPAAMMPQVMPVTTGAVIEPVFAERFYHNLKHDITTLMLILTAITLATTSVGVGAMLLTSDQPIASESQAVESIQR